MPETILIAEDHSLIRLAARRQLQAHVAQTIVTCTGNELESQLRQWRPKLLIIGSYEMMHCVTKYAQDVKVLLILPVAEEAASFPRITAVVGRENLSERLVSTVRFLLPASASRPWPRRPRQRARAAY